MALTKVNSILVDGAINTDASGNVGIGGTPAARLDVVSGNMIVRSGNITGYDNVTVTANAVNTNGTVVDINSAGTVGIVKLSTNNTERMRITSAGLVTVGTAFGGSRFQSKVLVSLYIFILTIRWMLYSLV